MLKAKSETIRLPPMAFLHSQAIRHGEHDGRQYEPTSMHGKPISSRGKKKESKPDAAA